MAGLCGELKAQGHDVAVVLPYYRSVKEGKAIKAKKLSVKISVPLGSAKYSCDIFEGTTSTGVKVYLVGREEFYDRTGLYGSEGRDYQDNAARFFLPEQMRAGTREEARSETRRHPRARMADGVRIRLCA